MIVIAKKNTGKLIKDYRYEVVSLKNSGTNKWGEGTVTVKDVGTFTVNNFVDTNGSPLPKTDIIPNNNIRDFKFEDLKKGDILVCRRNMYKNIIPGNMYKIVDLKTTSVNETDWQGKPRVRKTNFIKLDGHRFLQFNPWAFRKLNTDELRDISLSAVLDGEVKEYTVDKSARKIDNVENKDLELMKIISKAITDPKRHHLSIIDWSVSKINHRMDVDVNDFEGLLNMSLKDILEKIKQD